MYSISWKLYRKLQMKGWLTCSSMRLSLIIFRTLSDRTTVVEVGGQFLALRSRMWKWKRGHRCTVPTFILANVFQGKRKTGIFSLDDSNFSKGASADNPEKSEMVQVHWWHRQSVSRRSMAMPPSSGMDARRDSGIRGAIGSYLPLRGPQAMSLNCPFSRRGDPDNGNGGNLDEGDREGRDHEEEMVDAGCGWIQNMVLLLTLPLALGLLRSSAWVE